MIAQNGPGTAAAETTVFDAYGRPTWTKDVEGFINALEYDPATGAMTKTIVDVNTTTSTNEPAGWVTPTGGGLHITTTMVVDALGRTTKVTDPNGNGDPDKGTGAIPFGTPFAPAVECGALTHLRFLLR